MKAANSAVVISYVMKLVPVLAAILVTKGVLTKEQVDAAMPVLNELLTWIAGGVGVIALVVGWFRSLKSHGSK